MLLSIFSVLESLHSLVNKKPRPLDWTIDWPHLRINPWLIFVMVSCATPQTATFAIINMTNVYTVRWTIHAATCKIASSEEVYDWYWHMLIEKDHITHQTEVFCMQTQFKLLKSKMLGYMTTAAHIVQLNNPSKVQYDLSRVWLVSKRDLLKKREVNGMYDFVKSLKCI